MNSLKFKQFHSILYPFLSIALMLLAWHLMFLAVGSQFVFPSISTTFQKIFEYLGEGSFWLALLHTLARVIVCFVFSLVLAVAIGTLAKVFPPVGKVMAPVVAVFRSAPTVAMMVILTLIVKPNIAPVIVGLLVIFPMLYANVNSAINQVDVQLLQMCKTYRLPKKQQLKFVYLPTVVPYLLGELPATLSFAVKLIISAEILSYSYQSIGGLIQSANVYVDMAGLFALTILSVVVATLLDVALRVASKLARGGTND